MKKVISILLCVLMLVSALSLSVFAADNNDEPVIYGNEDGSPCTIDYSFENYPQEWVGGTNGTKEYRIKSGCTFVVPAARGVLNVPYKASLIVEEGAHLVVNAQFNVAGEAHIYGKLTGENVTGQENVKCYVEFPDLTDANINLGEKIDVRYYMSNTSDEYGDVGVSIDKYVSVPDNGVVNEASDEYPNHLPVTYNTYLYVRVIIQENENEDKYDDKTFPVKCNGVVIPFDQNACPVLVISGSDITFGSWVNDATYYNTYTITLPAIDSEGYTVYARNGDVGVVTLKYGQAFSFRVELEEDYNKSSYKVYVTKGNGWSDLEKEELLAGIEPAVPDAEGSYNIPCVTDNYSVFVQGVMSNDMLGVFSQVFNIFRQIWDAISKIFNQLFGEGGISGLLGGTA